MFATCALILFNFIRILKISDFRFLLFYTIYKNYNITKHCVSSTEVPVYLWNEKKYIRITNIFKKIQSKLSSYICFMLLVTCNTSSVRKSLTWIYLYPLRWIAVFSISIHKYSLPINNIFIWKPMIILFRNRHQQLWGKLWTFKYSKLILQLFMHNLIWNKLCFSFGLQEWNWKLVGVVNQVLLLLWQFQLQVK